MAILESIKKFLYADEIDAPQVAGRDTMVSTSEAAGVFIQWMQTQPEYAHLSEAFTQADIELALDDRGWLVGGKRMAGELDPLSRQVQINRSRYYWLRDPLVKQAVRLWTDYAFGAEAMTWESETPETQKTLDKFMKNRRNRRVTSRGGQRRLSHRLLIDGEIFFAFFDDGTVRIFDPLQISDIITDKDDEDVVVAYKRTTAGKMSEQPKTLYYKPWDYDSDELPDGYGEIQPYYGGTPSKENNIKWEEGVIMYHLPFDPFEKRGTTLISACSDWSREHRRFMTARVALTQALARFAFKAQVKGGQRAIDSIRSKMESTFSQTGLSGGTEHQPPNAPGGIWMQNEGVQLEAMPRVTGAGESKQDADNLKLQVCAGVGIGLHYFGDNSTGNLATSTAMELPMLKMFGAYQQLWKDAWRDIFSIVLGESPDDEVAEITINMPDIIEEDLAPLAQVLTAVTGVFPEAKTPAVLRRVLTSMGVEDLDSVMEEIMAKRETMDANVAAGKNPDGSTPTPIAVAGLKNNGAPGGSKIGGATGTVGTDANESIAESLRELVTLLR